VQPVGDGRWVSGTFSDIANRNPEIYPGPNITNHNSNPSYLTNPNPKTWT